MVKANTVEITCTMPKRGWGKGLYMEEICNSEMLIPE